MRSKSFQIKRRFRHLIKQDLIDLSRAPDRLVVLKAYNESVEENKNEIAAAVRDFLDELPSQAFTTPGQFVLELPVVIEKD